MVRAYPHLVNRTLLTLALTILVVINLGGCLDDLRAPGPVRPTDYIRDDTYKKWVVEVDHAAGERPADSVLSFARGRLADLVEKPDGISMQVDDRLPASESRVWRDDDLRALQDDHQDQQTGDGTVVTHMVFVDGRYRVENVLGVAIGYDLIVIFSDRIKDGCANNIGCSNPNRAMEIVVTHELGHAIGLVNRGIDMVQHHEDPEHPKHSDNEDSVMYHAAENSDLFEFFGIFGSLPDDFDANDRQDVCNAGGKC